MSESQQNRSVCATPLSDDDYWQTLPLGRGVTIIARDAAGLIALNKPAGTLSHPNEPRDQPRSLLTARYEPDGEFYEWEQSGMGCQPMDDAQHRAEKPHGLAVRATVRRLWLLNRLDSATSGVILAATTEKLAREIRALFKKQHISKTYVALVFGHPSEKSQLWRDKLSVQKRGGQIRAATRAGNIPAEARMTMLRARRDASAAGGAPISLIQLEPKTGRSHQLRVQCAKRRLPIIGDATYGDFRANRDFAKRTGEKRLFLHSLETRFDYTHEGRAYSFSAKAPLPETFTTQF